MDKTVTTRRAVPFDDSRPAIGDGRRQRSSNSRRKIITAMFELLREGDISPTAASVADKAGVGLRTVFRHFEVMDSIYAEMAEQLTAANMPTVRAPFTASDWREQLMEVADRTAELYERVFPFQVAMSVRRYQSDFLQRQFDWEAGVLRAALKAILPNNMARDLSVVAAIEVTLSFSTWARLRTDQGLSAQRAQDVICRMIESLIARHDAHKA